MQNAKSSKPRQNNTTHSTTHSTTHKQQQQQQVLHCAALRDGIPVAMAFQWRPPWCFTKARNCVSSSGHHLTRFTGLRLWVVLANNEVAWCNIVFICTSDAVEEVVKEEEEVLFLDPVLVFLLVVFGNGGAPVDNNEVLGEVE
jgi:hypothetical protein